MKNENTDGKVTFYENTDSFIIEAKWKNFFSFQKKMDSLSKEKEKIATEGITLCLLGKADKIEELKQKAKEISEKAMQIIKEEGEQYAESLTALGFADKEFFKLN